MYTFDKIIYGFKLSHKQQDTMAEFDIRFNNTYNEIQTLTFLAECELYRGEKRQARTRLAEAQDLLNQYGQTRPYYRLRDKVKNMATAC